MMALFPRSLLHPLTPGEFGLRPAIAKLRRQPALIASFRLSLITLLPPLVHTILPATPSAIWDRSPNVPPPPRAAPRCWEADLI